jgi:NAD(P)-dependent dehydrogenase (short-subunit alcohol dehydrogenase family)
MGEAFARRGMAVVLADINAEAASAAAERLARHDVPALGLGLDVRDPQAWEAALDAAEEAFGPVAILCSNAGVSGSVLPLTETSREGWTWTMDVNLGGTFNAIRHGVSRLKASGLPGWFVATSSLAPYAPSAHNGAYAASKAAVISLCEALRCELAGGQVGVSVLAPGLVRTSLLENADRLAPAGASTGRHSTEVEAAMAASIAAEAIGEAVAQGVEAGAFWLLPDPISRQLIEAHNAEILSSLC